MMTTTATTGTREHAIARIEQALAAGLHSDKRVARAEPLLAAFDDVPRLPELGGYLFELIAPFLDEVRRPLDPRVRVEGLLRGHRLARLLQVRPFIERIGEALETLADLEPTLPRVVWCGALARAHRLARSTAYAQATDLWRSLAHAGDATDMSDARIELALLKLDIELAGTNDKAAERAATEVLTVLEGRGPTWDGERYAALNARALTTLGRDETTQALADMEAALGLARFHGLASDEAAMVRAIVPLLVGLGRGGEAEGLLTPLIERLGASPAVDPEAEMSLHHLRVRTLEVAGRLGPAIRAGMEGIKRSGAVGTLRHYTGFVVQVAFLYQKADRPLDALVILDAGKKALAARNDSAEWLATLETAREALAQDLGRERFEHIMQQRGHGDFN